jgi:hypothetical protein
MAQHKLAPTLVIIYINLIFPEPKIFFHTKVFVITGKAVLVTGCEGP